MTKARMSSGDVERRNSTYSDEKNSIVHDNGSSSEQVTAAKNHSQINHFCKSCNEPFEMCLTQGCGLYSHRCDPLFALSAFSSDDNTRTCQGFGSVLQYQNCDVIGASCDQMFTVQNMQVCEYCRSADGKCRIGCEKPVLYFARRRPPFASDEGYGKNGYRIDNNPPTLSNKSSSKDRSEEPSTHPLERQGSWKIPVIFN